MALYGITQKHLLTIFTNNEEIYVKTILRKRWLVYLVLRE